MGKFSLLFKKVGGAKLLFEWMRLGVLHTAIGQVIVTGLSKKSLEMVRNAVHMKIYQRIKKRYSYILDDFDLQYKADEYPTKSSKKVWVLWLQGINDAPIIVQKCYNSLLAHLKDREIILLTEKNFSDYAILPDYIIEKYNKGIITRTHLSDLLRLELLSKYGGTWIDATVFCASDNIPSFMLDADFFIFQNLKPGSDGSTINLSSWFMTSKANNHLILALKELFWKYWKKENRLLDYFLIHYFITLVEDRYSEEWKQVPKYPNSLPHILLLSFFERYNKEQYQLMLSEAPFHKLSYKFSDEQKNVNDTYYQHFITDNEISL